MCGGELQEGTVWAEAPEKGPECQRRHLDLADGEPRQVFEGGQWHVLICVWEEGGGECNRTTTGGGWSKKATAGTQARGRRSLK